MSENVSNIEEEIKQLRQRIEKLETLVGQSGNKKTEETKIEDLYKWQQNMPRMIDYDVWTIVLAKKTGTNELKMGTYAGGGDYTKIRDLSPEDGANLAGALSHAARILILKECEKTSQYPSDLEKMVSAKYGALYHHIDSIVEANLLAQEKERGKYVTTPAGKSALLFLNVLASVIDSIKIPSESAT